jgi:thiol:disulfide interchange protein DsbC
VKSNWILFLLSFACAAAVAQGPEELSKEELAAEFPGIEVADIQDAPLAGMYEVAIGSSVAYVSKDGRYIIQGDLYDLDDNANLTERRRSRARVGLLANVDPNSMIVFGPEPADVKHTVTIFTDIDCGYCRQFHREIDKVIGLGIEVHYLFYPRTGPDTESWDKADKVWCAADRKTALTEAKLGGRVPEDSCDATPVASQYDLGQLVGVRGTPSVFAQNGEQLGGYLTPEALFERLEELEK